MESLKNNITLLFLKSESMVLFPEIWDYISKFEEIYFDEKIPYGILWAGKKWIKFKEGNLKIDEKSKVFILSKEKNIKKIKKILKDKKISFNEIKIEYRIKTGHFKDRFFCVVRPFPEALEFSYKIENIGAKAVPLPLLKFKPLISGALLETLEEEFDYCIFTSKRGVNALKEVLCPKKMFNFLNNKKIISIGPETARELRKLGYFSCIPEEYSQEGIVKFFENLKSNKGKNTIILRTDGRKFLNKKLKEMGYFVKEIKIYKMLEQEKKKCKVFAPLLKNVTDFIFTSPRLFDTFLKFFGGRVLKHKNIIPIGKVTATHIRKKGFYVNFIPQKFTGNGILEIISKEV